MSSIIEQVERIEHNIDNAFEALADYGVERQSTDNSNNLSTRISQILVPVTKGGTGAATPAEALFNLGAMPASRIRVGTAAPSGTANEGDIYIQYNA